jgi:hypothetical protein
VRHLAGSLRLLLYVPFPVAITITSGSQRSREGYLVISRTKEGARARRNRMRAGITTAAAIVAAAALAGPAQAAVSASADDPNTTLPASFTDSSDGLAVGLCADGTANCSSLPPDPNAPVSTANFDPSGEAFWMLVNASFTGQLSGSVAEFALEAAFLGDILPHQGSTFSRIRFRFDLPPGHYRVTYPYGVKTYDVSTGGDRSINDSIDTGCLANPCDPTTAGYGPVTSILRWDSGAPNGYIGDAVTPHKIAGSPTGINSITVEKRISLPDELNPDGVWEIVDSTDKFTVEGKVAGAVPAAAPFVGVSSTRVTFPGRRSDQTSSLKKVTVTNTGAAPLTIGSVVVSGADAGDFTKSGSCVGRTAPLAAQASCDVLVGFIGGGAVGERNAVLSIASDAANAKSLAVELSGSITALGVPADPQPNPGGTTTIIQVIPGPLGSVLGTQASSSLAVSRLTLARRISITRLRAQGLRASMQVQEGTNVVRLAIYKARGGLKTGRAVFSTTSTPRSAGLFRVTLRSSSLSKLKRGTYVLEARAGRNVSSLGSVKKLVFTVTP